jgi:hypothetical protein
MSSLGTGLAKMGISGTTASKGNANATNSNTSFNSVNETAKKLARIFLQPSPNRVRRYFAGLAARLRRDITAHRSSRASGETSVDRIPALLGA